MFEPGNVIEVPPIYPTITLKFRLDNYPARAKQTDTITHLLPRAWGLYRAVITRPHDRWIGDIRVVTRPEKVRWWIRCHLAKWGII